MSNADTDTETLAAAKAFMFLSGLINQGPRAMEMVATLSYILREECLESAEANGYGKDELAKRVAAHAHAVERMLVGLKASGVTNAQA